MYSWLTRGVIANVCAYFISFGSCTFQAQTVISCTVTNACPSPPPPKPYAIPLNNLLNGGIKLAAPIDVSGAPIQYDASSAQSQQGGWSQQIIQENTNQNPPLSEALSLSNPLTLLADSPLSTEFFQYPAGPLKFITNPSVIFNVPIVLNVGPTLKPCTGFSNLCSAGDGDYGVYTARVEDCLSTSDHTQLTPSVDFAGNKIPCTKADGTAGNWYDIAPIWGAKATLGPVPANSTSPGQPILGTLAIPATLPLPTNVLRIEFAIGLADTPNGSFIDDLQWFTGLPNANDFIQTACCNTALTRFAVNLPAITVLPAALVQMKVLPYTILYRPPGDLSSGTYSVTQSFSSTMSVGQSSTIDQSGSFAQTIGANHGQSGSIMVSFLVGFSIGGQSNDNTTTSNTSTFDSNISLGYGLTGVNSSQGGFSFPIGSTSSDPTILPALSFVVPNTCSPASYPATCAVKPPETYLQEPFWEDQIVLLLHPQLAVWSLNGMAANQLIGSLPQFDKVSVSDLYACTNNSATPLAWRLSDGDYLSPSECQELLNLDPFFGPGQSLDPSLSGRAVSAAQSTGAAGVDYGRDPKDPEAPQNATSLASSVNYSVAKSTNSTAIYNATVTGVMGFSWSNGQNLAFQGSFSTGSVSGGSDGNGSGSDANSGGGGKGPSIGGSGSVGTNVTLTNGIQSTSSTSQKITYSASSVATQTDSTSISGSLNDDHDFYTPACQQNSDQCKWQHANIFIDELFGSFMFQDPYVSACNTISNRFCQNGIAVSAPSAKP